MTLGTAGADWAGLMIFIIMIFSIMIFVIMLRWLTVTGCDGCSQRVFCISTAATALPLLLRGERRPGMRARSAILVTAVFNP